MKPIEIRANINHAVMGIGLYFLSYHREYREINAYAENITFNEIKPGDPIGPAITISEEAAQKLLNDLWNAGIRPKDYAGAGEIEATNRHLKDMQKIAFMFLDKAVMK